MKRLFIGNFEFEHRLARGPGFSLSDRLRRINEDLSCVWLTIAQPGDFLWLPAEVETSFFEGMAEAGFPAVRPVTDSSQIDEPVEVCPWGWTSGIRSWSGQQNCYVSAPTDETARTVNSRRFSFQCETAWDCGLPESVAVESVEQLMSVIARNQDDQKWVVKAEFSMSARERLLGLGRSLSEADANWLRKRLDADGVVFYEPWVESLAVAGIQFDVPRSGPPHFVGLTVQLTGKHGEYQGSLVAGDRIHETEWGEAIQVARRTAQRVQAAGYWGPLGIDAMRYRSSCGETRVRPIQDVNARYTMGRLALGLRRFLQPNEVGEWQHVRWSGESMAAEAWYDRFRRRQKPSTRLIRTSPFRVGKRDTEIGTAFLLHPAADKDA